MNHRGKHINISTQNRLLVLQSHAHQMEAPFSAQFSSTMKEWQFFSSISSTIRGGDEPRLLVLSFLRLLAAVHLSRKSSSLLRQPFACVPSGFYDS